MSAIPRNAPRMPRNSESCSENGLFHSESVFFQNWGWERVGPYRIGNAAALKTGPKYTKNTKKKKKKDFRAFSVYFCPILLVGPFSYSLGGQPFPKIGVVPRFLINRFTSLDGRNRTTVIAESLARVIAANR